ncbi:dihydrofolate reductase family protein [Streptomyces gardneri]|uniref:dihydrofolate reductase family protein n=1 Tax=Nocardia TaxID=1817 RepID=UPI0013594C69|nr:MULTISPECIES: dihydrofolate reductase family protein [Nocardia]MBF6168944.1 dihydrofolate reductase family protein [Streptomyces gardneri]MBF6207518.1 dihydrofolate reductase family protein [Streptomyces gardneri]
MRKLVYYIGMSVDGYIAGPAGEYDFYPYDDEMAAWINASYPEFVPSHVRPQAGMPVDEPNKRCDSVVMGRGTYAPALAIGVTSPYAHLKQYVVSSTLGRIDDPAVELVDGDPVEFVRELKRAEGGDIWLAGGGKLAAGLLGEIDEMILKCYPVVAGAGVPVFSGAFRPTLFTPVQRKEFGNGAQVVRFTRA